MIGVRIGVVCYGNIARSQVLSVYIKKFLKEKYCKDIEIYSAGTAPYSAYPNAPELIKEVEQKLAERGIKVKLTRNSWTDRIQKNLKLSDLILVADSNRKEDIKSRIKSLKPRHGIHTFYEFIGQGDKDFEDTYDYKKKRQNPAKFGKLFDELERIARKAVNKIKQMQNS